MHSPRPFAEFRSSFWVASTVHFLPVIRPTAVDAAKSDATFLVVGALLVLLRDLSCRRDSTENTTRVEKKPRRLGIQENNQSNAPTAEVDSKNKATKKGHRSADLHMSKKGRVRNSTGYSKTEKSKLGPNDTCLCVVPVAVAIASASLRPYLSASKHSIPLCRG